MAFGSENDIKIKIEVDNSGAVRVLDSTGKKIQEFGDKAERSSGSVKSLGDSLSKIKAAAALATGAFAAATAALGALAAAAVKGGGIRKVEESFVRLNAQAGALAYDTLAALQDATDGTVTALDLMRQANDALTSGIKPDQLTKLAKAADAVADATGADTLQTLNKYINAFQKGNAQFVTGELGLKNYAKIVQDLTKKLDLQGGALNEDAKKLIDRNILLFAAEEATRKLGGTTTNNGETIERWGAEIANATNNLLSTIAASETLDTVLRKLEASVLAVADGFIELFKQQPSSSFLQYANLLSLGGPTNNPKAFADLLQKNFGGSAPPAPTGTNVGAVGPAIPAAILAQRKEQEKLNDQQARYNELLKDLQGQLTNGGRLLSKYTAETAKSEKKTEALADAHVELYEQFQKLTSFDGIRSTISEIQALNDALSQGEITGSQFEQFLSDIINGLSSANIPSEEIGRRIIQGISAGAEEQKEELQESIDSVINSALESASTAITSIIGGGSERDALAGFSKSLLSSIGSQFGPVGQFIGDILGEIVSKVIKGTESAAKRERKSLDKALGDILRNNPAIVVVDDIQKAIDDLDLTPAEEEVERFKQTLDSIESNSINAAAVALEQLAEELGVEVAEIRGLLYDALIANLGGSILNLRSLLSSLGKDAADLSGALFDAFAAGAISAAELVTLLQGIQTLFSPGIPNAIGAVDEAFKQFQGLAQKGGTAAIESLKALGVEALETGATTLEQLGNILVQQYGFGAQEVAALFEALRAAGVTTLEQLAQASSDTGIAILANFQNIMNGIASTVTGEQIAALRPQVGGGGGGGAARAAEDAASAVLDAVLASEEYKVALDSLNAGLLSNRDLQKVLNSLTKEYATLTKQRDALESKLSETVKNGGKVTAAQAKELSRLNAELERFGAVGEESFREVNKALIRFSDQFSNDANLMGLAAEAAGYSFEQLKKPIVDAFRAGKISAKEALEELEKYSQGLGTAGATAAEAFENFLKAGTSGGAVTLDAFKDIFGEAIKAGGKDLIDLESQLLGSGVDRSRISKLFESIRSSGIDSLDQLASASDETIIGIIAKAQDLGLPFSETSNEVRKLLTQLEKIRNSPPIKVRISADLDPTLQEVLDLVNGRRRGRNQGPGQGNTTTRR